MEEVSYRKKPYSPIRQFYAWIGFLLVVFLLGRGLMYLWDVIASLEIATNLGL